ncbi:hypothetical protein [Acinetobacter zhairhuonensis]|uniref:hypothetical protein n=1 Tax=Acinetobacter sp. A7.4 TaxID=2919921 RepID=UPI001F4DBAE1|nr:hypothetical protein [Acinetobacter sp. A7.4]MCJ8160885.1 hypothetical protein [Acinetobacter sp. A7.4]
MQNFKNLSLIVLTTSVWVLPQITIAESNYEQELKQGCGKLKQYARLGKQHYDHKQYAQALSQFQDQAAWSHFCQINADESGVQVSDRDIDIANNNVGLTYAKLGKPLWARAWFLRNPDSKMSQFNLSQLPTIQLSTSLAGTYVAKNGFGQWDTITVKKLKNAYQIEFEGYYFGLRGLIYGPNLGSFDTQMPLQQKKAVYRYEDCQIQLNFTNDAKHGQQIVVEEQQNTSGCGFGHNVSASGTYMKVETN